MQQKRYKIIIDLLQVAKILIFKLIMHQVQFCGRTTPGPTWRAYSAPTPPSAFRVVGWDWKRKGSGMDRCGKGTKGDGKKADVVYSSQRKLRIGALGLVIAQSDESVSCISNGETCLVFSLLCFGFQLSTMTFVVFDHSVCNNKTRRK